MVFTASQLFLLADHIKLSLLERQRALSLNLEPNSRDGQISRSLESLREGLEEITKEKERLDAAGDSTGASNLQSLEQSLQSQFDNLTSQFHGFATTETYDTISSPNEPTLSDDLERASKLPQAVSSSSSFLKKPARNNPAAPSLASKTVHFSNTSHVQSIDDEEVASRVALFPYRDDPISSPPDQSHLGNQQIHAYHSQVLAEQDEQLDRLGESIGRQRDLSIQIGDELDGHVALLDEIDGHVDRHQSRLDQARKSLGHVARKANDNKQLTTIIVLIIILVLLITILK